MRSTPAGGVPVLFSDGLVWTRCSWFALTAGSGIHKPFRSHPNHARGPKRTHPRRPPSALRVTTDASLRPCLLSPSVLVPAAELIEIHKSGRRCRFRARPAGGRERWRLTPASVARRPSSGQGWRTQRAASATAGTPPRLGPVRKHFVLAATLVAFRPPRNEQCGVVDRLGECGRYRTPAAAGTKVPATTALPVRQQSRR